MTDKLTRQQESREAKMDTYQTHLQAAPNSWLAHKFRQLTNSTEKILIDKVTIMK